MFTKEEVFERIWGIDSLGETSTVMVHINRLRAKIDKQFQEEEYIDTVWGVGYRFHKWDNYKKYSRKQSLCKIIRKRLEHVAPAF